MTVNGYDTEGVDPLEHFARQAQEARELEDRLTRMLVAYDAELRGKLATVIEGLDSWEDQGHTVVDLAEVLAVVRGGASS